MKYIKILKHKIFQEKKKKHSPAWGILILVLHKWLSVFHELPANVSDLSETAHGYLQEGQQLAHLESEGIY